MNIESLQQFLNNLRIEHILFVFATYLLILWLLVPIWVFIDSKKKFHSNFISTVFALLVLPFNIPGVIFYIIIRPDDSQSGGSEDPGIINIPIANFTSNKDEVIMGIELKINGALIDKSKRNDINLNVSIDSDSISEAVKPEKKADKKDGASSRFSSMKEVPVKALDIAKRAGKNVKGFLFASKKNKTKEDSADEFKVDEAKEKPSENKVESTQPTAEVVTSSTESNIVKEQSDASTTEK